MFCSEDFPFALPGSVIFGRTFTDAYIRWYQANNLGIDMKVPVSMFDNGLHARVAEQQKLGTEECDTVYQRISHVGQVVGVRIPDNPAQPPTIIPQVARYNQQARPLSFSGTSIQVGHKECTPTN